MSSDDIKTLSCYCAGHVSHERLAKNTLFLTVASVGQKVIAFLYFTVIARTIGVESLGAYFIALAMVTTIGVLDDVGLTSVVIREVAKAPEKAKQLLRSVIGVKLVTMPFTVLLVLVLPMLAERSSLLAFYDPQTAQLVTLALAIMLADTLSLTLYGVLRGMHQLKYESLGIFVGQILSTLLGAIFLLTGNGTLPLLVTALIAGSVWNALFSFCHVVRRLGWGAFVPSFAMSRPLLQMSMAFFLSAVFVKAYSYVDSFTLKAVIGDEAVGLYSVAYKLTYAFQFLPLAFVGALYPTLAAKAGNPPELRRTFLDAEWYLALLAAPIVFGIFALSPEIIQFFYGIDYAGAASALSILIFVLLFIFLDFPIGSLLNATGRQLTKTAIMGATMVVNIASNLILIPRMGIDGASTSAVISFVFMFAAGWLCARRLLAVNERDLLRKVGGLLVAGAVMAVVVVVAKHHMPWMLTVPLGAAVFAAIAFVTKSFTWAHAQQLRTLLRPEKYAKSTPTDN